MDYVEQMRGTFTRIILAHFILSGEVTWKQEEAHPQTPYPNTHEPHIQAE